MNKHTIARCASLALALSSLALPLAAADNDPKPKREREHVEVQVNNDFDATAGATHFAFSDLDRNVKHIFAGPGGAPDQPLIITTNPPDEESLGNMEEDLNIMARILDKTADREDGPENESERKAMGIQLWTMGRGGRSAPHNLYLEGHGAIFILGVNIPLVGSKTKEVTEEKKESTSVTWESARTELYGGGPNNFDGKARFLKERNAQSFDAGRVENLKKGLVGALKNASHIRGLKDNETVTLVVQGSGGGRAGVHRVQRGPNNVDVFTYGGADFHASGPRTVMTLRAKKSDIDAFAKGRLDEDEFRKKVSVSTYQTGGK